MANQKKISELTAATAINAADVLPMVQAGNNLKLPISVLAQRMTRTNTRIAILGDSITDYSSNVDSTQIAMPARGDMGYYQFLSNFACDFSFGRDGSNNRTGGNYGESGNTTSDVIARLDSVIASMKADKIGRCFVRIGINDLRTGIATATIKANLTKIWQDISDAGIEVVPDTLVPCSYAGYGLTVGQITTAKKKQYAINNFIREMKNSGQILLLRRVSDAVPYWIDRTSTVGDPIAGRTSDGTHPNDNGGYYLALARYEATKGDLNAQPAAVAAQNDLYDFSDNPTGCINLNPLMLGTAGTHGTGSSGPVADSYKSQRGSGSTIVIVCSKASTAFDGNAGTHQIQTITANGTGATGETAYLEQAITTNFTAGDVVKVRWPAQFAQSVGSLIENFRLEVRFEGGTTQYARHLSVASGVFPPLLTIAGTLGTQNFTVPATCTTIRARIITQVNGALTGTVILDAGDLSVRKVV